MCKAVADAMSPGYPEIDLFLEWQNYQDQVRVTTLGDLRSHSRSIVAGRSRSFEGIIHTGELLGAPAQRDVVQTLEPDNDDRAR